MVRKVPVLEAGTPRWQHDPRPGQNPPACTGLSGAKRHGPRGWHPPREGGCIPGNPCRNHTRALTVPCGVQGRPGAISDLAPAFSGGGGYRLPRQALPKPSGSTRNPGRRYGPVLTTVPPVMHAATRRATCHPCTTNPVLVHGPSAMAWWPCRVPRIRPPPGSVGAAWRAVSTRYRLGHTLQCSLAGVLETPARYWRYGGCRLCVGTRLLPWISSPRRSLMAGHTACPNPSTCTGRPGTKRHGPPGATSAPRRRTMPEVFRAGTTPVYRRCRVACRVSQELSLASACDSWAARGIDPQAKLCPLCPRPAMGVGEHVPMHVLKTSSPA